MALINCPECTKQVSDQAASCPNCGFPLNTSQSINQFDNSTFAPEVLTELQGTKVSIAQEGKLLKTENGKILISQTQLSLKGLIFTKDICDLSQVNSLEHKGRKLILRLPETFYVVDFMVFGKEADALKAKFSSLLNLPLEKQQKKLLNITPKQAAIAGVCFVVLTVIGILSDKNPSQDSNTNVASRRVQKRTSQSFNSKTNPTQKRSSSNIFHRRLYVSGQRVVLVAVSKAALSAVIEAAVRKDKIGHSRLILSGQVFGVKNNTRVLFMGGTFTTTKFRILEGKHLGRIAWAPSEWVKR